MEDTLILDPTMAERDREIAGIFGRESRRLMQFIRRRIGDEDDAADILQDAFAELVAADRLLIPIERAVPWLFRVARNRIIDRFRSRAARREMDRPAGDDAARWEDLLPSNEAGPAAAYARKVLVEEIDDALEELPAEQRDVFVAHEIDGKTFKEISAETGTNINTLLSRKRYAVRHLRRRLREIREEIRERSDEP